MIKKRAILAFVCCWITSLVCAQQKMVWEIGKADNKSAGMALAPSDYSHFLTADFGWEDRFYLIGYSDAKKDWPYAMPGPADEWGGTGNTSGIRSQVLNILFDLNQVSGKSKGTLIIDLLDYQGSLPPLVKVLVNGKPKKIQLPVRSYTDDALKGNFAAAKEYKLTIPVENLRTGGNEIQLTSLSGSWLIFDQVRLEGDKSLQVIKPAEIYIRQVKAAGYTIKIDSRYFQPLLLDVSHLRGKPEVIVKLDDKLIFSEKLDTSRYEFEVPMPAVAKPTTSRYEIFVNGHSVRKGRVTRSPFKRSTPADYVNTKLGSAHSRWMIAPGPWMPFSMVKLSPDNQNSGWTGGYDPTFESIGTFSHIHEWTMAGLGMMPTAGPLQIRMGDQNNTSGGYRSGMDKETEETPLGLYKVMLSEYHIKAELTSTTRASFQRYTYPKREDSRVMIDLMIPAEYSYELKEVSLKKVSDYRIEGSSKQFTKNAWSGGVNQDYTVHFVIEFDRPVKKYGTWMNGSVVETNIAGGKDLKDAGAFVEFDTRKNQTVQVRSGISLVSVENAGKNLSEEITRPFGWDFTKVVEAQKETWNNWFGRLEISSNDRREKMRFYSNMFRALASRNTWSDVDGSWVDASKKVQQLKDPEAVALGCDAFWNTFWNLNQFWNLATPEWSSKWVKSQLTMYDANGWLSKGPAGMNYVPVMVAEHEIPLIVGAYQMGIRDYDVQKAFDAVYKMQTTPAQKVGVAGFAGNRDLEPYLKYKYVPYDKGRFSNTLEYAYDDWTVGQFAKSLGKEKEYKEFHDRSGYWKNVIDQTSGFARMKKSDGSWFPDFDPFKSGANEHYVEGNAWQLTYFVPQDIPELINKIGKVRFMDRLSWGFEESHKLRFNAPGDQYWDYPVIQGNQQSMHFAFLFNWAQKPWLTQKWSRSILDRFYGYGPANAYLGDEDQGQMSAWFIMNAIGLFQTDGGASVNPIYEIGSPIFSKVTIHLNELYGRGKSFTIEAPNVSRANKYVQSATLNGKSLDSFWFPASELLKGGKLRLEMGELPNENWGIKNPPVSQ